MREVKKCYLYRIFQLIEQNKTPEEIQKELNLSKQNLYYYRKDLKTLKYIEYVSYGVWKIVKKYDQNEVDLFLKEVKKTTRIGINHLQEVKNIREVRGHAFQIKLVLPENFKNWKDREKIFKLIGLKYENLLVGGIKRGQQTEIDKVKVHLYNKSIVFNLEESYLLKTAKESRSYALVDFLRTVKKLERIISSPLSQFGKYKFTVTRQHYALIKNSLAKQYLNENKKLEIYTGKGLWLLIDNSFNLEELETVHPETADEDNEKVQTVFNNIKKEDLETLKEMSPGNIKKELVNLNGVFPAMKEYNENLKLHTKVQQEQLKTQLLTQEVLTKILTKLG